MAKRNHEHGYEKEARSFSDELGKARDGQPFLRKKQAGAPRNTHTDIRKKYAKILLILFKLRPGRELFR